MRPSKDEYFLEMARVVAMRSTCLRRAVGAVLVDVDGHVLTTGYNGRPAGMPHCNQVTGVTMEFDPEGDVAVNEYDYACDGSSAASGERIEACEAVHAEQNALLQCPDARLIDVCYVTVSPCLACVKMLLNTDCRRIVFAEPYAHDDAARALWESSRRAGSWQFGPSPIKEPQYYE